MRTIQVQDRTDGNDPGGINFVVGHVIVALDMVDVHGLSDARLLIEVEHVSMKVGIIHNAAQVAFEVPALPDEKT